MSPEQQIKWVAALAYVLGFARGLRGNDEETWLPSHTERAMEELGEWLTQQKPEEKP